ncbi:MAG: dihydroxyacetone kinase [Rhodospirillaceae bacterium]|nr:dihydroxyacetone kinase [Rhodospirillaceae bacterium]
MEQFINTREDVVTDSIDGFLRGRGDEIVRLDGYPHIKVVLRSDWKRDKVSVISGGGSGHEPAHAGFVGAGLLTAAICGEVFASPSVEAVLAGILAVTGDKGCLLIVKNYTGDRLNFGLAAEKARSLGLEVEMVVVDDDVALPSDIQARGIAGTLFVHKIAGALAEAGNGLDIVSTVARSVAASVSSIGISLGTCTIPGGKKEERIASGMAEIGLGIHGEPGAKTVPHCGASEAIKLVLTELSKSMEPSSSYAMLLNNLGGCTPIEMAIITEEIAKSDIAPMITQLIGPAPLMTSLDMHGFSVSILPITEEIQAALFSPVPSNLWPLGRSLIASKLIPLPADLKYKKWHASNDPAVRELLRLCCEVLEREENDLNDIDLKIGDGDTGSTLVAAVRSLRDELDNLPLADTAQLFFAIAEILSKSMGGSSGVLLALMFSAAGKAKSTGVHWVKALELGLERVMEVGGAKLGDRTMIDALAPALAYLDQNGDIEGAARAARAGADETSSMSLAKVGRAAYVPTEILRGVPDPGAEAVARLFEGLHS